VDVAQILDPIQTARDAAGRYAWREAYETYGTLPANELAPEDLERFAEAAWWRGRPDEAIGLRERAYAGFSSAGDKLASARLALTLADDHVGRGSFAVAQGWFANAERLLEGVPESAEHGVMALMRGVTALFAEGDIERAVEEFEQASELGSRFGDRDTQVMAIVGKGRALVKRGDVEQGFALLDEATAAAVCGELRPVSTGLVYCITISSCNDLGDYRRSAEWTEVANRWCDRLDVTGFPGMCRIHRAEVMRLRGDWPEAEQQAIAACEEVSGFNQSVTAGGYYEIGEIRRFRGDFAGAMEAYATADELGKDPQPGVALLRLAEGKVDSAVAGITRSLGEVKDPLARLRRLPAAVEIAIAASDLKTARSALAELEEIVDSYKIGDRRAPAFDAGVHVASGRLRLAEGDAEGAARCLKRARDEWQQVGAPFEAAQARMLLGLAFRRQGDENAATGELEAALATFERLGAKLEAERTKELLGRVQARRTFVFTDIVDSTKLLETLGNEKWKRLLARHDELLRERIVGHGGEIVKRTGDGFFAAFDTPKAAIEAAVGIQRALDAEVVAPDVRIGLHTGEGFHTGADARDYGGEGVHIAARVGSAAQGGEILVSRDTLDGVGTAFRVSEPRSEALHGLSQPIEVVSIGWR
jgi:class 3 adenylate cyclase